MWTALAWIAVVGLLVLGSVVNHLIQARRDIAVAKATGQLPDVEREKSSRAFWERH